MPDAQGVHLPPPPHSPPPPPPPFPGRQSSILTAQQRAEMEAAQYQRAVFVDGVIRTVRTVGTAGYVVSLGVKWLLVFFAVLAFGFFVWAVTWGRECSTACEPEPTESTAPVDPAG